jgi:sentrin-specific protease 8
LAPRQWLNDSVISFQMQYLQHTVFDGLDVLLVSPASAFVLLFEEDESDFNAAVQGMELETKSLILFPINNNTSVERSGGSHWSLLSLNVKTLVFRHFDSSGRHNEGVARQFATKLAVYLNQSNSSPMTFTNEVCPRQSNDYDCGLYVVCFSEQVAHAWKSNLNSPDFTTITPSYVSSRRAALKELIGAKQIK